MTKDNLQKNSTEENQEFIMKKEGQLNVLENHIINGENNVFRVLDHEAGLGKSLQAEKSMVNAWKTNGRKSLYVTFFKDSKDENSCVKRINDFAGEVIAIAIDSENKQEINNYIDKPILVITHERYKSLCIDISLWKKYSYDRYNLIIDELPDMLEIYTYTLERIEQFENLLPRGAVKAQYNMCIKELEDYLKESKGKSFFNTNEDHRQDLNRLKQLINSNVNNEYCANKYFEFYNYATGVQKKKMDKSMFLKEVEILRSFYENTCCIERKKAFAFDYRLKFKLLRNSLILDANASFSAVYKFNPYLFNVQRQSRIINHDKWELFIFRNNTNKNAKGNYLDFYDKINNFLDKIGKDNLLLIGSKDDEQYFQDVTKEHFGNFLGKNTWRNYNKIVITHNYQIPFYIYALKYIYFSNKRVYNNTNWDLIRSKENKAVVFNNNDIESVRITELAGHLYQAVKRINRDNKLSAQVYIFNSDERVLKTLKSQFIGININLDAEIEIKMKEIVNTNKRGTNDKSFHREFINLLKYIMKGKYKDYEVTPNSYSKGWCMEMIQFTDTTHFAREILNKSDVQLFVNENNIKTNGKYIKFTKPIDRVMMYEESRDIIMSKFSAMDVSANAAAI